MTECLHNIGDALTFRRHVNGVEQFRIRRGSKNMTDHRTSAELPNVLVGYPLRAAARGDDRQPARHPAPPQDTTSIMLRDEIPLQRGAARKMAIGLLAENIRQVLGRQSKSRPDHADIFAGQHLVGAGCRGRHK